ncbi:hypothetical protein [Streptomyces oceani]|uniref:AraC-type arabinose-binding/dimerisation domain-containing protein n=1 Tax=Streptomyces oceani TaxID=1075402 RepID=A0A1E7KK61_9ACTN|nr:hypothetical protein [Streptomyces oceani]OEV04221.1 hypothetical protein AN216_08445 [Streptomyces oceani]
MPRVLCDTGARTAGEPASAGVLWKLAEPGRQLDSNLVHLPAGQVVDTHAEPDLDVLLLVVAGRGTLRTPESELVLTEGLLTWLPRGSSRGLTAGDAGLSYLTVHQRRPGMRIRRRHTEGGDETPAP